MGSIPSHMRENNRKGSKGTTITSRVEGHASKRIPQGRGNIDKWFCFDNGQIRDFGDTACMTRRRRCEEVVVVLRHRREEEVGGYVAASLRGGHGGVAASSRGGG